MPYATAAQRYDVVCIGDVATDVFIRLPEGPVEERLDERGRWLRLPVGAKVPFARDTTVAAGGSAANAAIALARLVHIDAPAHTNRNFVLSFHGDRTILVHHEEFEYHWSRLRPNEVPAWLLLSSLGPAALGYQDGIADWLDENPSVHLAFQPGTFQIEAGAERLERIYARADVLLCSRDEAAEISGGHRDDPGDLLDRLLALGPSQVVVFDEVGGAVASDGTERCVVPPFPDTSVALDRTGAEDAFGATLLAGLLRGMPLREALRWPPVNYMTVSHELGSQSGLLREKELQSYLDEIGADFAVHSM